MTKKLIVVIGATGAQGGGLAKAILADKNSEFAVRALTRKPEGDAARALAASGAEIMKADLDDVGSLQRAFDGADAAFCVTNYWEHMSPDKEIAQARNLADASKASAVKHVIWSTLEDTRRRVPLTDDRMPTLHGRFKVPHFDTKGESDAFFDAGRTTWLVTSFYWDNLIYFGMGPKPDQSGKLAFTLPMGDKKLPGIAAEDIGKCALGLFKRGTAVIGKRIGIAGEHLTGAQMAQALSHALEREVVHQDVPPSVYRSFGFPGADDLGNMFQYKAEFEAEYCGARSLSESRALNPELMTFAAWLAKYKSKIPLA
ncbi:MAG TPA: NmrA/HSCARG family protein [Polyangiaceae bacterium]|nr:NmrA/HSCARG family protein [Polyangiaceae bacterium]